MSRQNSTQKQTYVPMRSSWGQASVCNKTRLSPSTAATVFTECIAKYSGFPSHFRKSYKNERISNTLYTEILPSKDFFEFSDESPS